MHRRITAVFEFRSPDFVQRRMIWRRLTSSSAVCLAGDVDLDAIALKYEITGGYIRGAVLVTRSLQLVTRSS